MTFGFRIIIYLALGVTGIAASIGYGFPTLSREASGSRIAWALMAEAEELCRFGTDGTSNAARRAVAGEALEIARSLVPLTSGPARTSPQLRTAERLERGCAGTGQVRSVPGGGDRAPTKLASLDGSGQRERQALLVGYLERLGDAASDPELIAEPTAIPSVQAPDEATTRAVAAVSRPALEASQRPQATPPAIVEAPSTPLPESPAIVMAGGSRESRVRVARWLRLFAREGSALRRERRELQIEIDVHSVLHARVACRAFDRTLADLDPEFETLAPSLGLSRRIARMVAQYRRGSALCMAGRSAAAYAHLSEGDREWATVAQIAARTFAPRPLRAPLRPSRRANASAQH